MKLSRRADPRRRSARAATSTPSAVFEILPKQLGVCLTRLGDIDVSGRPTGRGLFAGVEPVRDGVGDGTAVGPELRRDLQGVEHAIADDVARRFGVGLVETRGDVVDDGGRYINSRNDRVGGSGHKQELYARALQKGR
jgi:hypothetical protein